MTFLPVTKIIPPYPNFKKDIARFISLAAKTDEEYIPRLYYSVLKTSIPSLYEFTLHDIDKCSCFPLEELLPNELPLSISEKLTVIENTLFKLLYPFTDKQEKTPSEYYFFIQIGDCVLSVKDWLYFR